MRTFSTRHIHGRRGARRHDEGGEEDGAILSVRRATSVRRTWASQRGRVSPMLSQLRTRGRPCPLCSTLPSVHTQEEESTRHQQNISTQCCMSLDKACCCSSHW